MILVFKTNVNSKKAIKIVRPILNGLKNIIKWNFDLNDCDKILRVDTPQGIRIGISRLFAEAGFTCVELE